MIWYKQGVCGDLNRECQKALGRIAKQPSGVFSDTYVTAIRDGNHMAGSFHYIGDAFDFKRECMTLADVKAAAGKGFDVVEHSTHFHVEWDPKS